MGFGPASVPPGIIGGSSTTMDPCSGVFGKLSVLCRPSTKTDCAL